MNICGNETEAEVCKCLARVCPVIYNNSLEEKEACYMERCFLSKKALDDTSLIQVTSLYLAILVIGLVGNISVCVVIRRHPIMRTHSSAYLLNLAVADLVTLCVGLPFEIMMNWNQYPWPFPDFVCNLKAIVAETTMSVSILTILLFAVERYVAVCHPFLFVKTKWLRQHVSIFLVITWIISILSALPFGIHHRADYLLKHWPYTENGTPVTSSKMCMIAVMFEPDLFSACKVLFHFSAIMFFLIPLSIILILYVFVGFHVKTSSKSFVRADSIEDPNLRVTIILCSIICAFFICYLPFHFQRLAFLYVNDNNTLYTLNQYLYFISGILFYLATIINPILYNLVSTRFRKASKEVWVSIILRQPLPSKKTVTAKTSLRYTVVVQSPKTEIRSHEFRTDL